jgi:hypothetical protein
LRERTVNLNANHNKGAQTARIHKPKPFIDANDSFHIKLVFLSVAVVTIAWIGVLISLGAEIIGRMSE